MLFMQLILFKMTVASASINPVLVVRKLGSERTRISRQRMEQHSINKEADVLWIMSVIVRTLNTSHQGKERLCVTRYIPIRRPQTNQKSTELLAQERPARPH